MKTKAMPAFMQIEEAELRKLMTQVKEEVANDVTLSQTSLKKKKFGVIDLWNCRRLSRRNGIIIR